MRAPSARTRYLLRPPAPLARTVRASRGPATVVAAHGALSLVAVLVALARGQSPIGLSASERWLSLPEAFGGAVGHGLSLAGGALIALLTVQATRQFVHRWGWARALHADLRPAVRHASATTIFGLGIASAIGEELFFRGLLATTFGVVASSLAFGLLHRMGGRVRWIWAGWATVMGFLFGALFMATGSLIGAIVAHAAINVANLRFLRDTDVGTPNARRLGGLLGRE